MLPHVVVDKLDALPAQPGCYLFRGAEGEILYIGKAKSLRSRVRSYFQEGSSDTRAFLPILRRLLVDLDTLVVSSEKEAAILENSLIKQHRPRFNIKLRDDKEFLSLRLDPRVAWPRLDVVRKPAPDGARYFGPYPSATSARRTLHLVNKHFQLRTCTDADMAGRTRPCLQYQIKRCPGPCVYEVDAALYGAQVRAVGLFLDGRHDELSQELEQRMRGASREMRFEEAAAYRDQLRAVQSVQESQRLVGDKEIDQDVIGLYREGELVEVALMYVRKGRVNDTAFFSLRNVEVEDDEVIGALLRQYYDEVGQGVEAGAGAGYVPDEVLAPVVPEGVDGVIEWLSELRGRAVKIVAPQRGDRKKLLDLAQENAAHAFREKKRAADDIAARLAQIQQKLRLPVLPRRIECIDISHLGGQDTVGAIVALRDGVPDKKRYRTFHVKGVSGGDDYGAMREVLSRRFKRALASQPAPTSSPLSPAGSPLSATVAPAGSPLSPAGPVAPAPSGSLLSPQGHREGEGIPGGSTTPLGAEVRREARRQEDEPTRGAEASGAPEVEELDLLSEPDQNGVDGSGEPGEGEEESAADHGGSSVLPPLPEDAWSLPDLLVVDGGRGQLNVALGAARDLGIVGLSIVGLAKERENVAGETMVDRVYLPGQKNGVPLKSQSAALVFLARARDEAHRFSNKAREKLGQARRFRSALDGIPGVGPKTKRALLEVFGTVAGVAQATDEALRAVPGVTPRTLRNLRAALSLTFFGVHARTG
jgi:excinuclease ABC subunit C